MAACTRLTSLELHQQVVLRLGQVDGLASCEYDPLLLAQGWSTQVTVIEAV